MKSYINFINDAYTAFNKRDIEAVLSLMNEDVHWPNGWEGGYVSGYDEVRDYWTRQWKELNPTVIPVSIEQRSDNEVEVTVHQIVKDIQGNLLFDGMVKHVYTFRNDKIQSMEIVK